jgi:ATP-dependent helicase/nuclease subunit B
MSHAQAIAALDDWVVRRNHVDGLHALLRDASIELAGQPAAVLVDALARAAALMPTHSAPASFRVDRLLAALDALQARAALALDACRSPGDQPAGTAARGKCRRVA